MTKLEPISKELIQECFGRDCKISRFFSHWTVRTPGDGRITITPNRATNVEGDDRIYRGLVLISERVYGGVYIDGGGPEFRRAVIAAADRLRIPVEIQRDKSNIGGWFWVVVLNLIGIWFLAEGYGLLVPVMAVVSLMIFFGNKNSQKHEHLKTLVDEGYIYPRHRPGEEWADDEDFRKTDMYR